MASFARADRLSALTSSSELHVSTRMSTSKTGCPDAQRLGGQVYQPRQFWCEFLRRCLAMSSGMVGNVGRRTALAALIIAVVIVGSTG